MAGAATSFLYLDSFGSLFATGYGLVLLAKVGGFALVAAAGYFNWQKVRPVLDAAARQGDAAGKLGAAGGADADRGAQSGETGAVAGGSDADRRAQAGEALLLRAASLELAIAVAVLALTAVLVALPMPAG
jgi:putative copper export protein